MAGESISTFLIYTPFGNTANKSIVTITGVVSDTEWFNNSYEREGQGCGTIIGESGGKLWILTEKKTIKDAAKIKVTFVNDAVAEAKLVRYDGNTGLAALTVDLEDLEDSTRNAITVMKTAGLNTIHKGSIVIALGSPLGTNYSILTGTITATNNEISTPDNNYSVYTTDIVASENGSGVLINMDGEFVGVVMQSYSAASANTPFGISYFCAICWVTVEMCTPKYGTSLSANNRSITGISSDISTAVC